MQGVSNSAFTKALLLPGAHCEIAMDSSLVCLVLGFSIGQKAVEENHLEKTKTDNWEDD